MSVFQKLGMILVAKWFKNCTRKNVFSKKLSHTSMKKNFKKNSVGCPQQKLTLKAWFWHILSVIHCQIFSYEYVDLVSWESEATPSVTQFFKRACKISHFPRLWASWFDLPSFATFSKIWSNFRNKTFLLKLGQIFDELANLGKSTQDTYNRGGRRIANFVSPFEKWGRRRCRFRLSWH